MKKLISIIFLTGLIFSLEGCSCLFEYHRDYTGWKKVEVVLPANENPKATFMLPENWELIVENGLFYIKDIETDKLIAETLQVYYVYWYNAMLGQDLLGEHKSAFTIIYKNPNYSEGWFNDENLKQLATGGKGFLKKGVVDNETKYIFYIDVNYLCKESPVYSGKSYEWLARIIFKEEIKFETLDKLCVGYKRDTIKDVEFPFTLEDVDQIK